MKPHFVSVRPKPTERRSLLRAGGALVGATALLGTSLGRDVRSLATVTRQESEANPVMS
jgi:hypothetical protein